jgi:altronate dehydratase
MAHSAAVDAESDRRLLLLDPRDNVLVTKARLQAGEVIRVSGKSVSIAADIPLGHKLARCDIPVGGKVLKYGAPIGSATAEIHAGEHAHVHNIRSDYTPTYSLIGEDQRYGDEP